VFRPITGSPELEAELVEAVAAARLEELAAAQAEEPAHRTVHARVSNRWRTGYA
jgi:hypothetical protein